MFNIIGHFVCYSFSSMADQLIDNIIILLRAGTADPDLNQGLYESSRSVSKSRSEPDMDPGMNLLPMYLLDTDPNSDLKDQWDSIRFQRLSGQQSVVQVLLLHKCYIPRVSSMQHSLYVRRCTLYNVLLCSTSQNEVLTLKCTF